MSSSYILPVIFCVLAHEIWQSFVPDQEQQEVISTEMCVEDWEPPCAENELIIWTEQQCQ